MCPRFETETGIYDTLGRFNGVERKMLFDFPDEDGDYQTKYGVINLKIEETKKITYVHVKGEVFGGRKRQLSTGFTTGPTERVIPVNKRKGVAMQKLDSDTKMYVYLHGDPSVSGASAEQ